MGGISLEQFVKILKSIVFYPLLWLRGIFKGISKFISGAFLLLFIISLFIKQMGLTVKIIFAFFSFIFFMLAFFYDQILLKLNPTGNVLILPI